MNVEVCSDCGPTESCPPLQCAPFYTPNSETCECEFDGFIPLGNGEEGIDLDFEGGGSLLCSLVPSLALGPSLGGGECPPGQWWSQKSQMCLPDEPLNCEPPFEDGVPVECMQCPPGTTYNEESGCCEPDEILGPIFSGGTTCESYTLQLGECEDHQNGCTDPSQYSNQNSCESAGCSWSSQYTDAGNCVFP